MSTPPPRGDDAPVVLIANLHAGSAPAPDTLAEAAARLLGAECRVLPTSPTTPAGDLAVEAARAGARRIAACGGDGTLQQVVEALVRADLRCPVAVVPFGTGNDFAGMVGMPDDLEDALAVVRDGRVADVDVLRVEGADGAIRYGINASVGSSTSAPGEQVAAEDKRNLGPFAYVVHAAERLADLPVYELHVTLADGTVDVVEALGMVVANGRTCAGRWPCAPLADPQDGLLDVLIVGRAPAIDIATALARLASLQAPQGSTLTSWVSAGVRVVSTPPLPFNLDGEECTMTPCTFSVLAGRQPMVVGPGYSRDPR